MNAEAKGFRSLDLGLNHHEIEGIAFETKHGQEVGNRFLRLSTSCPARPASAIPFRGRHKAPASSRSSINPVWP